MTEPRKINERGVIFLVGSVQFINILDFMMVMPLGPDFSQALGIPASNLGYIAGSYTAAAAVSGIAGSFFLDRFDRRSALAVAMIGLVVGTAMGGLATGLGSLMWSRVIAGVFGGPATSISLSIIADVVPPERRGKALGAVMGAFSLASVLGVPAGLELARRGGWPLPFFAVAALGLLITIAAFVLLPPLKIHLVAAKTMAKTRIIDLFARPMIVLAYLAAAVVFFGMFALIPHVSSYLQFNLGYPREDLGTLYLAGGALSFFITRLFGMLTDRFGAPAIATFGAVLVISVTYLGFYLPVPPIPVLAIFMGLMCASSIRGVAYNTLASKVPLPHERARYMSIQSAVQHISSALAGFYSAMVLVEQPDHRLVGMPTIALISIVMALLQPPLMWVIQKMIIKRDVNGISTTTAPVRAPS